MSLSSKLRDEKFHRYTAHCAAFLQVLLILTLPHELHLSGLETSNKSELEVRRLKEVGIYEAGRSSGRQLHYGNCILY